MVAITLRLRGGGFAAVVPIKRMMGQRSSDQKTTKKAGKLSKNDAALIDALKNITDDDECQKRVLELLTSGASVRVLDPMSACDYGAVHLAASRGLTHAVNALVAGGAAVDQPAKHGQTPLSLAAARGYNSTVECLLSLGAEVSQQDLLGWTPLHQAAFYGSQDIVRTLLAAGADPTATIRDGTSVVSLAQKNPLTPSATAIAIVDAISVATLSHLEGSVGAGVGKEAQETGGDKNMGEDVDAAHIAQLEAMKLGEESPIMQMALAKGQVRPVYILYVCMCVCVCTRARLMLSATNGGRVA